MVTVDRTLLVDWETALLAPAERDWRTLVERGLPADGLDAAMLDMYDVEWRLDEISQYAAWFAAPHTGTASDQVAMGGLLHELTRAAFDRCWTAVGLVPPPVEEGRQARHEARACDLAKGPDLEESRRRPVDMQPNSCLTSST